MRRKEGTKVGREEEGVRKVNEGRGKSGLKGKRSVSYIKHAIIYDIHTYTAHTHTYSLHILTHTQRSNMYLTVVMLLTNTSTTSSPLWSTTVKLGPKSQKTNEEIPLTPQEMN